MKPTAYLINACRGPVVDEAALYQALKDNVIAGAGWTFWKRSQRRWTTRCLTWEKRGHYAHMAGTIHETDLRAGDFAYSNIRRVWTGRSRSR